MKPDENGIRLPEGFVSRVVAQSGTRPVESSDYVWHAAPDGGACFPAAESGWIYVSNSEMPNGGGGVGALRFRLDGSIADAYQILAGTNSNCSGGSTPWGTWLSCEEVHRGKVFECDPHGVDPALERTALGLFCHEATAVDPLTNHIYLTEDERDGGLYRFVPEDNGRNGINLEQGILQIAQVRGRLCGPVAWHQVPDPSAKRRPTRYQVDDSTSFRGAEGICHHAGKIYFTTKGDNRVWIYNISTTHLSVLYDEGFFADGVLCGVDNITISENGLLLIAEDGGDMRIVTVDAVGRTAPLLQIMNQSESEVTGPAFDPSGGHLYFSSQRGASGEPEGGVTYEVSGPFEKLGC